jgi:ribonuclease BN (tRNA processing enzyme)
VPIGDLSFQFSRTDHPVETLAVRVQPFDGGPVLAYSADTGPGWDVGRFEGPVDLALLEGTLLAADVDEADAVHLTAKQAGAMAKAAGVRRLVLTHIPPTADRARHQAEAAEAFGADVELATPHTTYEV